MPLRILHTSDWHLGATTGGLQRRPDHDRFLAWLTGLLRAERTDLLVVAGDVFDQANPSAEALRQYYGFLVGLQTTAVRQVVVVAGNHDSPSRLEAPRELLDAIDVHVVGTFDREGGRRRALLPVHGEGRVEAVVAAVPYVHEYRLGIRAAGLPVAEAAALFRDRFAALYRELADEAVATWPGVPLIATGHLTCVGATPEDSPVPIHLAGSIGVLPADVFDPRYRYVALGHIHRPMRVAAGPAWYSGTPVALRLQEADTPRRVLALELDGEGGPIEPRAIEVPRFRRLVELRGDAAQVRSGLEALAWHEELPPLVWVRLQLEHRSPELAAEVRRSWEELWPGLAPEGRPHLARLRQDVPDVEPDLPPLRRRVLASCDPEEVFAELCEERNEPLDDELLAAFRSLLGAEAS
jgi:DNA repair protein SbcD/Mre11